MMTKTVAVVICILIGGSFARETGKGTTDTNAEGTNNVKRDAPVLSSGYGPPAEKEPAPVYGPPSSSAGSYHSHGSPQSYSKSIPAAAIRNVETVAVTKTITPVVTKTTTYNTHSEPALSVGHVQGYSQSAVGQPKIAPVQFQTQYTTYLNPTVGVNGPVTYTGPAVIVGGGYALPLSLASLGGVSSAGAVPVYGPPAQSSGSPASGYGAPGQAPGQPLGSYSMQVPQIVAFRHTTPQQSLQQQLQQQYQAQLALASRLHPVAVRTAASPATQYGIYRQPVSSAGTAARQVVYQHQQPQQQQQQSHSRQQVPVAYLHNPRPQQPQQQQPIAQPSVQFVQTYTAPSISYTSWQPIQRQNQQHHSQPLHHQQIPKSE